MESVAKAVDGPKGRILQNRSENFSPCGTYLLGARAKVDCSGCVETDSPKLDVFRPPYKLLYTSHKPLTINSVAKTIEKSLPDHFLKLSTKIYNPSSK